RGAGVVVRADTRLVGEIDCRTGLFRLDADGFTRRPWGGCRLAAADLPASLPTILTRPASSISPDWPPWACTRAPSAGPSPDPTPRTSSTSTARCRAWRRFWLTDHVSNPTPHRTLHQRRP